MASVTLQGVTKAFGKVTAVEEVSLDVQDKEFLVLVGPSGCGKTTILRLIAGLETPTAGDIQIGQRRVNELSPKDRDVAMVFQSYALYPHMSVHDNIGFGLKMRHVPRPEIDRRVGEAAELLDILPLLKRKPRELSGGERQRVALARAVVREPQVFLMDEPLSNLDAKLRVQTRAELVKLQRRLQATVIYVTHDQMEAMTMADRIALLRNGRLQQVDTPQRVYDAPTNLFVAGFTGSPGMNFLRGRVLAEGESIVLDAGILHLPLVGDLARVAAGAVGREVVVGVRPEEIRDAGSAPPGPRWGSFRARVDLVEPLGSEKLLHLIAQGQSLVARVDPRMPAAPGDELAFVVDPLQINLYDAETEQALG
ncbi:MAG: sn-glycerol-3-phosphate ABC transporter ATP-binding protein UgpC [Chloroflexi bacterium]|nr:sn-glycerol-3-phosphate ABC transporter ATP-binding protein UgpC [Chloroflexota bacterium]